MIILFAFSVLFYILHLKHTRLQKTSNLFLRITKGNIYGLGLFQKRSENEDYELYTKLKME